MLHSVVFHQISLSSCLGIPLISSAFFLYICLLNFVPLFMLSFHFLIWLVTCIHSLRYNTKFCTCNSGLLNIAFAIHYLFCYSSLLVCILHFFACLFAHSLNLFVCLFVYLFIASFAGLLVHVHVLLQSFFCLFTGF